MRTIAFHIFVVAFLMIFYNTGQAADTFVVSNRDVPVDTLTTKELQRIYYGKITRWSNDAAVVPAMLASGELQDQFTKTVLKKTPELFKAFWRQAIFTGEGTPPRTFKTQSELLDFVAKNFGSIGFTTQPDTSLVKIIVIVEP
jgi:ABC-type phosphate transport system substrate-binding protein